MTKLEQLTGAVSLTSQTHAQMLAKTLRHFTVQDSFAPFVGKLRHAVEDFEKRLAKADEKARELSPEGLAKLRREADVALRADLDGLERGDPATLSDRAASMRRDLVSLGQPPRLKGEEAVIAEIRRSEIRQRLGQLDTLAAQVAYAKGGDEVRFAIETSPLPLLDPEYQAQVIEERSRTAHGHAWERLEDIEALAGATAGLLAAARTALGPDPAAPVIVSE